MCKIYLLCYYTLIDVSALILINRCQNIILLDVKAKNIVKFIVY